MQQADTDVRSLGPLISLSRSKVKGRAVLDIVLADTRASARRGQNKGFVMLLVEPGMTEGAGS